MAAIQTIGELKNLLAGHADDTKLVVVLENGQTKKLESTVTCAEDGFLCLRLSNKLA